MRPARRISEKLLIIAVLGSVLAFYFWTVRSSWVPPPPLLGPPQEDYQSLSLHGFLKGHLYLDAVPDARLVAAVNPWDPKNLPGAGRTHDVSYYHGHLYIYYGVTPMITLRLPWRLITGHDLPEAYSVLIFACTGFLASVGVWLRVRRRYFPESGALVATAGILVLGLGAMNHAILRRTAVWEEPVAAGYAFAMLSLLSLTCSLSSRRPERWLAAAGLLLGLAVGARPTYVFAAVFFLPLMYRAWRSPGRPRWSAILAPIVSLGAVLAALFAYNYARFGNPFEFGEHYQLNNGEYYHQPIFALGAAPANAYLYWLAPAHWTRYFPFVGLPAPLAVRPPIVEYNYGLLPNFPFVLFALLAPLAWRRRDAGAAAGLRDWTWGLAAFFAAMAVPLTCFRSGVTARYMVDFMPALMLLAGLGLLGLERLASGRSRIWVRTAGLAAAIAAAFVGIMLSFQLHGILRRANPDAWESLARAFDRPAAALERLAGRKFGPVSIALRFPRTDGQLEPLITTGWAHEADFLFLRTIDANHVQFGFAHTNHPVQWSPILPCDAGSEHRVEAQLGSLFPPLAHPYFEGKDEFAANGCARWLTVRLDGRPAFDQAQEFYDSSPSDVRLGANPVAPTTYGAKFTGRILSVRTQPVQLPPAPPPGYGARELTLAFDGSDGRALPLVTTGQTGRGDALSVQLVGPDRVRFAYDDWAVGYWRSGEVPVSTGRLHRLKISLPSLRHDGSDSLELELDGAPVWKERVSSHPSDPGEIAIGRNPIGASTCEPVFTGVITAARRLPSE